jgi:hypothetical protein
MEGVSHSLPFEMSPGSALSYRIIQNHLTRVICFDKVETIRQSQTIRGGGQEGA